LILLDPITLANRELYDGSADASAGWDDLGAFDRRKHSLLVCNRLRPNDDGVLGKCPLAQHRQPNSHDNPGTHQHSLIDLRNPNSRKPWIAAQPQALIWRKFGTRYAL
jgi:hypothetical protein